VLNHDSRTRIESHDHSQMDMVLEAPPIPRDPSYSGPEDEKLSGPPSRAERPKSQPNDVHEGGEGEEDSLKASGSPVVTPRSPKSHGVWCRIKRLIR